jgi:deazaflavin-dependent oxidoreductase (nitroreductase family)
MAANTRTTTTKSGLRAPRWVTAFNPISRRVLGAGVPLGPNALLTVPGRRSGVPRTTPLAIIRISGRRWVWAPWGDSDWVKNLRAAGRATLSIRGQAEEVTAVELDDQERGRFFRDVLAPYAGGMRGGFTFVKLIDQVDLHDPETAAEGRAVFELKPVGAAEEE